MKTIQKLLALVLFVTLCVSSSGLPAMAATDAAPSAENGTTIGSTTDIPLSSEQLLTPLSENLIKDGDMEKVNQTNKKEEYGWVPQQGTKNWGEEKIAYIDTTYKHSGNSSVRIRQADGLTSPFINQYVHVDAQTTYQFRAWTRQEGCNPKKANILIRFEFYSFTEGEDKYTSAGFLRKNISSKSFCGAEGVWTQFEQTITTPPGAQYVSILLRNGDKGPCWFDDVEFYKVSEPSYAELKTDQVFFYPDATNGAATFTLNRTAYSDFDTKTATVDFTFKHGEKLLSKSTASFCDDTASFFFDPALIEETKQGEEAKAHTIEAKLYQNGQLLETKTTEVYKYKRPDCIDESGNYYNNDGSLFIPVIGYHCAAEADYPNGTYQDILDGGINVVQLGYSLAQKFPTDPQPLIDVLDRLDSLGMKALICLYGGMVWASHPNNAEATKAVVSALSGHNAVFGWAVQDEPSSQIPDYETAMIDCYKLVKKYDTTRPVYINDTLTGFELRNSLYCDVYADSVYPRSGNEPGNVTIQESKIMHSSSGARLAGKPFYHLVQTFQYSGNETWFPNLAELRSMLYTTLLVGSRSTGYYEVSGGFLNGNSIYDVPELWENGLVEMVNSGEHDLMFDLLVYGDYPVFSREITTEKQYHLVLKDGEIYAVILNGATDGVSKDTTVSVPAVSFNGNATLVGGTAKALFGCSDADITLSADALSVKLPASGVAVIKISNVNVTAEILAENKFTDLADYPWASSQIEALARTGKIHPVINWYGDYEFRPGQAITRGEFAYFLINTLNTCYISKELAYTQQFKDVDADTFYAEALQIGKRLGIFKGDADNKFYPESPITRQDMMTLIARGMLIRYQLDTGKMADLSTFSDGASVADWARNATAVLLGNGIIKGNTNNTLDPLGNPTRAEAAVIMARIIGVSTDNFDIKDTESYKKDLYILTDEELDICEEILLSTDNIQDIWSNKLEKDGTTYVLVQNLKDERASITVSDCAGGVAEILCGVLPDDASYSYKKSTLSVTLNGHATALVKILPEKTKGFYNDSNVKIGYLCDGTNISAKKFESYPVLVGVYAQNENNIRQLVDIFTLSSASEYKPLTIPEVEGATAYSVEAFSWDWSTNLLQPKGEAYRLQSK